MSNRGPRGREGFPGHTQKKVIGPGVGPGKGPAKPVAPPPPPKHPVRSPTGNRRGR